MQGIRKIIGVVFCKKKFKEAVFGPKMAQMSQFWKNGGIFEKNLASSVISSKNSWEWILRKTPEKEKGDWVLFSFFPLLTLRFENCKKNSVCMH